MQNKFKIKEIQEIDNSISWNIISAKQQQKAVSHALMWTDD